MPAHKAAAPRNGWSISWQVRRKREKAPGSRFGAQGRSCLVTRFDLANDSNRQRIQVCGYGRTRPNLGECAGGGVTGEADNALGLVLVGDVHKLAGDIHYDLARAANVLRS